MGGNAERRWVGLFFGKFPEKRRIGRQLGRGAGVLRKYFSSSS